MRSASSPAISFEQAADDLDRFDGLLKASRSATAALESWINSRIGGNIVLRAHIVEGAAAPFPANIASRLAVANPSLVAHRRVRLIGHGRVYSDAHNWYVPSRLPDGMRAILADGQTPFGRVIESLQPERLMLAAERLWRAGEGGIPPRVLRHRALIISADGGPICEVEEVYTRNILT